MRAYIYDDVSGDQRLPHDSGENVSEETLANLGVTYRCIPIDEGGKWKEEIDVFAKEQGYKNINVTPEGLGESYESKIKQFFDEHLHDDEEIRFILGGTGFFDVRDAADKRWVRIAMEAGDLIVLPPGIYHRFTVDEGNTITAMRLFQDEPKWTPYSRAEGETDTHDSRKEYLATIA